MNQRNKNIEPATEDMTNKAVFRAVYVDKRKRLDTNIQRINSSRISELFCMSSFYKNARKIMLYMAIQGEPNLESVIFNAWQDGKEVYIPYIVNQDGIMYAALLKSMDDLVIGKHHILQPRSNNTVHPSLIDVVLAPGVAFDYRGNRLGMGGGYYDRFLPLAQKAIAIGVTWSICVVDELPCDKHDYRMHFLLTEKGILNCGSGKM